MTKQPDYLDPYSVIMEQIAPEVLERFASKGSDYGDSWRLLGAKGQFSDINRKFWKLYNSVWLDKPLIGEQPAECAEDIIGHCLLLLYILRRESDSGVQADRRTAYSSPRRGLEHHLTPSYNDAGRVAAPSAEEVLGAIRDAAVNESGDGSFITRVNNAVMALYQEKAMGQR